jgi:uncharacterized protein (TIGR03435 family)
MIRAIGGASLIVWMSSGVFGQSAPSIRAFEVASVKPHDASMTLPGISTSGPRLNADAANLMRLITYAYNLRSYQVSGAPPHLALGDARYDIVAKAEGDSAPTKDEFRQMLQQLLADRFKLKVHRETREMPVYELVVGKNGPKFKESAPGASPGAHYAASGRNYQVTIPKATMDDVLNAIENSLLDRPVLDKTGLTGTYDIRMTYAPDIKANRETPDLSDISIFTAVEQQLGLKLVAQKAMVEILVVDRVEDPSEN